MQKWIIGVLVLLVLFLAALNVRLSGRVQHLEERLAATKKRKPPPAPEPERRMPDATEPRVEKRTPVDEQTRKTVERVLSGIGKPSEVPFTLQSPEPELLAGRRPGFLGIMGEDVPGGGVKINGVVPDSVAVGSGLQPNDVLLEYNGEPITTLSSLSARIRDSGEGSPVSFRIRRENTEFYQGVQLGARAR